MKVLAKRKIYITFFMQNGKYFWLKLDKNVVKNKTERPIYLI